MDRAHSPRPQAQSAEIVDFDDALLDDLAPEARATLLAEADLLVRAFAPHRQAEVLEDIASSLSSGAHDWEMARKHARRLAAALRRLAREDAR